MIGAEAIGIQSNTVQLGRNNSDVVRIGKLSDTDGSTAVCLNSSMELAGCTSLRSVGANEIDDLKSKIKEQSTTIQELRQALCSISPALKICETVKPNEEPLKKESIKKGVEKDENE